MLQGLFSLFRRKPISAKEFERRLFVFLIKRITDKKSVAVELRAVENLSGVDLPPEQRQKLAAHWYRALENHIGHEQSRNRIPPEVLREYILRECHPEHAEGGVALMFLPSYDRQIKLFERFAEVVFRKVRDFVNREDRKELFEFFKKDEELKDIINGDVFSSKLLVRRMQKLQPAERVAFMKTVLKRAFGMLAQKVLEIGGDLRSELLFKNAYSEFRDTLNFIEDVPKVLLLVPDTYLEEERIGLMEKTELEEELRRKQQALEVTLAELQGEKTRLSSLTREQLEERVEERTAALVSALGDVKASQVKLEEAKEKDEAFLENIGEGLIAIDLKKNIILWNKAASVISGWSKEEASGRFLNGVIKFVHERDRAERVSFIDEAMSSGQTQKSGTDTVLVKKDSRDVAVDVVASPIIDEKNKVTSVIIIFRDISNERELQKAREEFASLATHELRTPVAAIKGYVSLLLDGSAGELKQEQKKYLEAVGHLDERLVALVNAMLNVSRIELGTLAVEPKPTYLPDVADAVISELSPEIQEKQLKVTTDYDRYVPIIDLDPGLMHAVFQNLLSNAVKYTPVGGKISIAIQRQKPKVSIVVADTGCGIPVHQKERVFDKLFRADNVRTMQIEGTGLGLYMVKSILDQSGGSIRFESEENKGTTFYVLIPFEGMKRKEGIKGLS